VASYFATKALRPEEKINSHEGAKAGRIKNPPPVIA